MACNLALWSMTLLPGDKYPLYIRNDFVITNVALPEELADESGRSVVKVTYHPINPALLGDDDSDSEIDSDDEFSGDEDEFELDEVEGFKEVKKAGVNGTAEDEDDDEEEDDEDEDDEEMDEDEDDDEDDDFFDDEPEVTNVLCSLTAGKVEQTQVNLTFVKGDAVMFEVTGKNAVHLMGNYIAQPEPHSHSDDEYDSEFDSDEYDDYEGLYDDDEEDEEDAPAGKITEILEKKTPVAATATTDKKRKAEAIESPASKAKATPAAAAAASKPEEKLTKKQKKALATSAATPAAAPAKVEKKAEAPVKESAKKRTLPSGLIIEDVKQGEGAGAKRGKRLGMR